MTTSEETEDTATTNPSADANTGDSTTPGEQETGEKFDQPGKAEKAPKKKAKGWADKKKSEKSALAAEKEQADAERDRMQDRLLRLQADFENYRKRIIREKALLYQSANEDLITELLPVLDHFDLALGAVNDHAAHDAVVEGVILVREQLLSALEKFGLKVIATEGQQFDPNLHEAISHMPSETVLDHGIVHETRKGYLLSDKLLRASQVVVSSGPASEVDTKNESESPEPQGD